MTYELGVVYTALSLSLCIYFSVYSTKELKTFHIPTIYETKRSCIK